MLNLENNGYRLVKQKSATGSESYALVHLIFGGGPNELKRCVVYVCVEEIATGKKCRLATSTKDIGWMIISQPVRNGPHTRLFSWDWDQYNPGYGIPALKRLCSAIYAVLPEGGEDLRYWFKEITGMYLDVAMLTPEMQMPVATTTKKIEGPGTEYRELREEWINNYLIRTWGARTTPRFVFETPDYEIVEKTSATGKKSKVFYEDARYFIYVREKKTGREIMLYRSSAGTDGKTRGDWYVTGGLARGAKGSGLWVIKGNTTSTPYGCMGRRDLCRLATEMNKILPNDSIDVAEWLKMLTGKDDMDWSDTAYAPKPFYIHNGPMRTDEDRGAALDFFKDTYLTPVWGKRDLERNPNPGVPRNFDINKYIMFYRQSDPMRAVVPRIKCASGLSLSVQAGPDMYSFPRTWEGPWVSVEVGFPSRFVPALKPYGEDFTESENVVVYHNVPVSVVNRIIDQNGGIIG